jgi:hypothetical protein
MVPLGRSEATGDLLDRKKGLNAIFAVLAVLVIFDWDEKTRARPPEERAETSTRTVKIILVVDLVGIEPTPP